VARLAAVRPGLAIGVAELVATELGTNLLRHAHPGGYILVRGTADGVELVCVDHGPGMTAADLAPRPDLPKRPVRGPLGGGLNAGLGVVRRHSSEFDWYATARGTVVYARLGPRPAPAPGRWRYGGVDVPLGGDGESGDAWAVAPGPRLTALLVDGLGHGPAAATAARAAITATTADPGRTPDTRPGTGPDAEADRLVRRAHEAMRGTRGGVLGVCVIDPDHEQLTYAAVGNITGRVFTEGRSTHLLDRPGTLGTHLARPRTHLQHCPWAPGSTLVLVSDGIRSGWRLDDHPRLLAHHPAIVAAVVHRDHARPGDDATVLVVRDTTAVP